MSKKNYLLSSILATTMLFGGTTHTNAQGVYDFSKVDWTQMVEVFHNALSQGKNYPTDEEIMALGISKADLQFIKSHVKVRKTLNTDNRIINNTYKDRRFWMNCPMGSGTGSDAGYPSKFFHSDVFSLWNYTSLWGSWNHGIAQVPGAWTDAAHKNGCDIMGGTVFFDGGSTAGLGLWKKMYQTKNDKSKASYNGFSYVKPLIHMLRFFGMDGININWEVGSPSGAVDFHKALYKYAHSIKFDNFHLGLYTVSAYLTEDNVDEHYADADEQIADIMLNYGGESGMNYSGKTAKENNPTLGSKGVWQGFWIVNMDHNWTYLNSDNNAKEVNLCVWGEHKDSRFWSYNSGANSFDAQDNYQYFLERAFSGGNRNPLNRPSIRNKGNKMEWNGNTPPLSTFCGFAEWIPERSTIKGKLPFATNFILGNGDRYNYYGKKTSGAWYNMSAQDVVPTYRWLTITSNQVVNDQAKTSDAISVTYSHNDAFTGGSCLELKGNASTQTDLVLFNTELSPNDNNAYALVAIKGGGKREKGEVKSNMSLILFINNEWKEYAIPNNKTTNWEEHRIELKLATNDKIEKIGVRIGGGDKNFDMLLGKIEINDDNKIKPNDIANFMIEKKSETPQTIDLKLNWDVNVAPDEFGLATNDDANIDHFEILLKDGNDGKIHEIARTSQWATFVGNINVENIKNPVVGVVAISKDLKTASNILWKEIEKDPNAVSVADADPFGTYGESSANKNAEGYKTALKCRAVESFKTKGAEQDVDFSQTYQDFQNEMKENDGNLYHKVSGKVLKVKQGSTFEFWLKGFDGEKVAGTGDDLRWCFVGGWIDFDGSGTFNYGRGVVEQPFWQIGYKEHENGEENFKFDNSTNDGIDPMGERVFRAGSIRGGNKCLSKEDGLHGTIAIPSDAHIGKSRLRIVYSDAWFQGSFGPSSKTTKGYTLDVDVEIVGDNVDGQRMFADLHDMGDAPQWVLTSIESLANNNEQAPSAKIENGSIVFYNTAKASIFTIDGTTIKTINKPQSVAISHLQKGVYIVKLVGQNNNCKVLKLTL